MAGLMIGGAFLSSFLNVVFEKLASPEVANLIRGKKLDPKLIQRLKTTLNVVRVVLNDAEKKQFSDVGVNNWLNELKDAVYVTDDLLDEIATKAATQKEEVSNLFSRLFNLKDREMVSKLEDIVESLESILKLKESLDLKEITVENSSHRTPSTCLQDGSHVYGRDKDKEAISKLLLDDNGDGGEEVSVIPIVGMGGVGKTTLAQLVYNDESLKNIFDLKAWVCVSEEFDILRVTKMITEEVTERTCEMDNLNFLHHSLRDRLKEKKFLIVLDDVWIEDYAKWGLLKKPFQRGVRGSKILVTTRSQKVASVVQTVQTYYLNQLSDEHCWLVFAHHACFSPGSCGNATAREEISREIVKKCAGLPLAAQSLGGILRRKHDIRDWENLLKSDIWELSESESKIIPALRVSYHYLPPHLKRCFVYCSLFPKDYEFEKDDLILLWMAEDLLSPPSKGKTLEEVGSECLDYLVARSFLQRSRHPWKTSFVMHDLLHDLATFLGGEFYFTSEEPGVETKISIKTRHLSFTKFSRLLEKFEVLGTAKFLRTFLALSFAFFQFNDDGKAACIVLSKLKHLRVLSFCQFGGLNALPDSIGKLIHLRYLNLEETSIMALPESLGNLYNLQTLKLSRCHMLAVLPSSMQNLVNLLYLDLSGTRIMALPEWLGNLYNLQTLKLSSCRKLTVLPNSMPNLVNLLYLDINDTNLKEMPRGMGKLTQLLYLSDYIVGKHEENGIKELGGLSNLHGSLSIEKLENVGNGSEALEAKIVDKKHISRLSLTWSSADNCFDSQTEMDILCKLQPHQDLQLLEIDGYRGTRFPDWVGNSSYHNMTDIKLSSCKNCCMLPSLGQLPSLKKLRISCLDKLVTIDAYFYKNNDSSLLTPFPLLESLEFQGMPRWEVWSPTEPSAFPKLKTLEIEKCPKLRGDLPSHLPALENLSIRHCTELATSLPRASAIHRLTVVESNKVALQELPHSIETLNIAGSPMDCSYTMSLFSGGCLPESLKTLSISNFRKLEFPKKHKHKSLQSLIIVNSCDSLTSLPLETFPNLKGISIANCENLESLSASQDCALQSLSSLVIENCPNFVSFPSEVLHAPSLSRFDVSDCGKLKSLPQQMNTLLPKLQSLSISNCPKIESFPEGGMPPSLRSIYIANCEKLLSDPAWPSMDMLTRVYIWGPCDGIKSFPKEGLLPSSLTSLRLEDFSSLETLDCKGLLHLTSLQELTIGYCLKLENIAGERLPASLTELRIIGCDLLNEPHRRVFDGIRYCSIYGPCDGIKSFPKEGLLPSSLTSLELYEFSSLETLDCKGLHHLTSLQTLTIAYCSKLENIAGERLPASLTKLIINFCSLLEERCRQKHPQVWPKISHVKRIEVALERIS